MVIYADVMFLINFTSNYAMLLLLGRIISRKSPLPRLLAASALGAAGAVFVFCAELSDAFSLFLKTVIAAIMVAVGYKAQKTELLRIISVFIFLLYAFSGIVFFLISLIGINALTLVKNGIIYFDISDKILFLIMIAAYPTAFIIFKIIKQKREKNIFPIQILLNGKSISANAFCDSGNLLTEPKSGKSVTIAEWETVKPLFGFEYEELPQKAIEYSITYIPYSSLGNPCGIIPVFTADIIKFENRAIEKAVIGISETALGKKNNYQILIGNGLI